MTGATTPPRYPPQPVPMPWSRPRDFIRPAYRQSYSRQGFINQDLVARAFAGNDQRFRRQITPFHGSALRKRMVGAYCDPDLVLEKQLERR